LHKITSSSIPEWTNRQVVLATLFVVTVGLGFWLIYRFRLVIFFLFIGIVLGIAIRPTVQWLNEKGIPRSVSIIGIYIFIFLGLLGFVWLVFPLIAGQIAQIVVNIPDYYQALRNAMIDSSSRLLRILGFQLPPRIISLSTSGQPEGQAIDRVAQTIQIAGYISKGLFATIAIFILGFYWTLESERAIRTLLLFLPADRREPVRQGIADIEAKLGSFMRGESILVLSIAVMSFIAYFIIGLPYMLVLALFAGIMEAVPVVGPILGAIPAAFVALTIDPSKVIFVIISTTIIQGLENYILVPRVMGKTVGINSFAILLSLAAFTSLLGLPGALLAVPLAAVLQILLDRLVFNIEYSEDQSVHGRDYTSVLRLEAQDLAKDVRMQLRQKASPTDQITDKIEDEIESIALELDAFLEKVPQMEENS
jgi:predicted PurR-regulated permease PerM